MRAWIRSIASTNKTFVDTVEQTFNASTIVTPAASKLASSNDIRATVDFVIISPTKGSFNAIIDLMLRNNFIYFDINLLAKNANITVATTRPTFSPC